MQGRNVGQRGGSSRNPISSLFQSIAHRISSEPNVNPPSNVIPLQNMANTQPTPQPQNSAEKKPPKPILITFLGDCNSRNISVINSLLRGSYNGAQTINDESLLPSTICYKASYRNPLQKQQIHKVVHAPINFRDQINITEEQESLYMIPPSMDSRDANFFHYHSFLIPQNTFVYPPTLRLLYGATAEVIVTYPSLTALRATLFELHQPRQAQVHPERTKFLQEIYKQVVGSLPTEKLQSPNQIIIPDSLVSVLGKTISYQSSGDDFMNVDRIFIREVLRNIYNTIGCLAVDIFVRLPCGILQTNCEICVLNSQLVYQPETQKRIVQIMNFSECVVLPVFNEKELSPSVLAVLSASSYLFKFSSQPGKVDLLLIDIRASQAPSAALDLSRTAETKQNIIGQLQGVLRRKARITSSMGAAFHRIQWHSVFPEYYHSQLAPNGTTQGRITSRIPLLAWLLLSWPLTVRGNRLDSSVAWQHLKDQLWLHSLTSTEPDATGSYYLAFTQILQAAQQTEQKPALASAPPTAPQAYIRSVQEYDQLLSSCFPMIQASVASLIHTQYSSLLQIAMPLLPSLTNTDATNHFHIINDKKIPYRKPMLPLSPSSLFSEYEEKTAKQLFHPLGNWNQSPESRQFHQILTKEHHFQVTSVQQGPNSQFRAFAHQVYGDENAWSLVKLLVLNDILQNSSTLYQHMLDASLIHLYLRKLNNSTISGDHVTLCSLANVYQSDILVFSPLFPLPIRIRPARGPGNLVESRVFAVAYFSGREYKSLFPSSETDTIVTSEACIVTPGSGLTRKNGEQPSKYRKLAALRYIREVPTLSDLAMSKIIEYCHLLPELQGALPEELIQQIISRLISAGKFADELLIKLLDPSIQSIDISCSNAVRSSTCRLIAGLCPKLRAISLQSCLNVGTEGVICLARTCGNSLYSINLSGCVSLTDAAIEEIALRCRQLVHIDLTGCIRITPGAIAKLSACPLLESLTLKSCKQITDPVIESLGNQLQQLDLTECDQITDSGVVSIIMKSEQLKTLKLSGRKITDRCLNQVAGSCHYLEHLELHDCEHVSDASVNNITQSCTQLTSLKLPNCKNITPAAFLSTAVSSLQNLLCLDLSDCTNVTDVALDYILQSCPSLQVLNLSSCEEITDNGVIRLVNSCIHLTELNLTRCKKLTDLSICVIAQQCHKLKKLLLRNCCLITDQSIVKLTKHCRLLTEFDISFCENISGDAIKQISIGFPSLEVFYMEELSHVDEAALISLGGCTQLVSLFVGYCNITDRVLSMLAEGCPSIQTLDISRAKQVTEKGIQNAIERWTKLKSLIVCRCSNITVSGFRHENIEFINFSWCSALEDSVIADIGQGCPRIQNLELAWCPNLTDASLDSIVRFCPQLHTLNIRGCSKISSVAVSMLTSSGRVVFR